MFLREVFHVTYNVNWNRVGSYPVPLRCRCQQDEMSLYAAVHPSTLSNSTHPDPDLEEDGMVDNTTPISYSSFTFTSPYFSTPPQHSLQCCFSRPHHRGSEWNIRTSNFSCPLQEYVSHFVTLNTLCVQGQTVKDIPTSGVSSCCLMFDQIVC